MPPSTDEDGRDDVEHVGTGADGAGLVERRLRGDDAYGLERQVGEIHQAALDRAGRVLAIRELILAVPAAVIADEGGVEVLDRLGNRHRAEHQVLVVAALAGVVDVEAVVASIFWWP